MLPHQKSITAHVQCKNPLQQKHSQPRQSYHLATRPIPPPAAKGTRTREGLRHGLNHAAVTEKPLLPSRTNSQLRNACSNSLLVGVPGGLGQPASIASWTTQEAQKMGARCCHLLALKWRLWLFRLWGRQFFFGASAKAVPLVAKTRPRLPAARPRGPGTLAPTGFSMVRLRTGSWPAGMKPAYLRNVRMASALH